MMRMVKTKIPDGFSPVRDLFGDPAGARTQDPNIKSVVLYLLSYRVILASSFKGERGIKRLQKYSFFLYQRRFAPIFFHSSSKPLP